MWSKDPPLGDGSKTAGASELQNESNLRSLPFFECEHIPSFTPDGIPEDTSRLHLLNIPPEIRLMIYDELIRLPSFLIFEDSDWHYGTCIPSPDVFPVQTQVMCINKQLFEESAHFLYGNRTLSFTFPDSKCESFWNQASAVVKFLTKVELRGCFEGDFESALSQLAEAKNLASITLSRNVVCTEFPGDPVETADWVAGYIMYVIRGLVSIVRNRMSRKPDLTVEQAAEIIHLSGSICSPRPGFDKTDFEHRIVEVEKGLRAEVVWTYRFEEEALGYMDAVAKLDGVEDSTYRQKSIWRTHGLMDREIEARVASGTTFLR